MEALHFAAYGFVGNDAVPHVRNFPLEKVDLSVHDPRRCRHACNSLGHQLSPNLFAITAVNASSAASASSPVARRTIVAPFSAASIITPMMLLAITSRSSRTMMTLLLNFPAVFTISAAGRAWIPSLLTIFTSRSGIRSGPSRERKPRELQELCASLPRAPGGAPEAVFQSTPPR